MDIEIKSKKRDEGVEVLRCILMLGICLIHATAYSTDRCWWLGNIANCSVAAFVFISGWYGIKCRLGKIINMVCMALWCALVAVALNGFISDEACVWGKMLHQFSCYWFLWCYIVVMLFAPMINKALDSCSSAKAALGIVLPVFILVFIWNWIAPEASITLRTKLPSPGGFGSLTFLSLVGIYVMAQFGRKWLDGKIPEKKFVLIVLCVCLVVVSLDPRLARNCSPFALLTSASLVLAFQGISVPPSVSRVIGIIAPSLFPVYLLHVTKIGDYVLVHLGKAFSSYVHVGGLRSLAVSAVVFASCIVLDIPRRIVFYLCERRMKKKGCR